MRVAAAAESVFIAAHSDLAQERDSGVTWLHDGQLRRQVGLPRRSLPATSPFYFTDGLEADDLLLAELHLKGETAPAFLLFSWGGSGDPSFYLMADTAHVLLEVAADVIALNSDGSLDSYSRSDMDFPVIRHWKLAPSYSEVPQDYLPLNIRTVVRDTFPVWEAPDTSAKRVASPRRGDSVEVLRAQYRPQGQIVEWLEIRTAEGHRAWAMTDSRQCGYQEPQLDAICFLGD